MHPEEFAKRLIFDLETGHKDALRRLASSRGADGWDFVEARLATLPEGSRAEARRMVWGALSGAYGLTTPPALLTS